METRRDPSQHLAQLIREHRNVVIITGAGLSAASGVPMFRSGDNSIWRLQAESLGTRRAFLKDPTKWYEDFWFKHFPHKFTRCRPNQGHEAIAQLASAHPRVRVVTQVRRGP
jgi:NAD-dependent deacetylase